jgi:hypothetical protein
MCPTPDNLLHANGANGSGSANGTDFVKIDEQPNHEAAKARKFDISNGRASQPSQVLDELARIVLRKCERLLNVRDVHRAGCTDQQEALWSTAIQRLPLKHLKLQDYRVDAQR